MVKKGQNIVDMNNAAIDQGVGALVKVDVPADWKTLLMKAVTKLNQAVNPAHLSFKTLHNQSMHKLVMIFLYPHLLVTKMVHYLLVLLNSKNAVLHCSFQNGYQKTVSNVTNVPSYVHMLQFVQSWQLKKKWLQLQNISIQSLHWALKTFNSVSQYPH